MPLYDYHCLKCRTSFSKVVSFDERNCVMCSTCGGMAQKQLTTSDQPIEVKVTGDRYHGVQTKKDLNKILEQRSKDRYNQEGAAEVREKFGADCVVEDKNPKKKQVVTK